MNKCHYYLSNGLWEVVKCQILSDPSSTTPAYFWGMAVAPHQACFASHIISTPWQQSWATLHLLKAFRNGNTFFTMDDIKILRDEVELQFTLRNYSVDDSVQALFKRFGQIKSRPENEISRMVEDILLQLVRSCPSTAHCLARQLSFLLLPKWSAGLINSHIWFLLIATLNEPPSLVRLEQLALSTHKCEFYYLLLAQGHFSLVQNIELMKKSELTAADSALDQLQRLVHHGIEPRKLFRTVVLTDRHFVLHLLDLLENSPTLPDTQRVPSYLWPLLLLRLWGKPGISESQIQGLINQCRESTADPTLIRVCYMLDWYISYSRWSVSQQAGKQLSLETARNHSVLHLIHASADLALCDWAQVRALLHEPWDIYLLEAFKATVHMLRAISAASAIKLDGVRVLSAVEAQTRLQHMYKALVSDRLKQVSLLIRQIKPLRFRLEVLENLFAVLFITYDDIKKINLHPELEDSRVQLGRGFISTANVVRDSVILLKECTAQLEAESKTDIEAELPCSIKPTQFENRLDRLSESLSEAIWRLQLVAGNEFVNNVGTVAYNLERHDSQGEWFVDHGPEIFKNKRRWQSEKRDESALLIATVVGSGVGGEREHSRAERPACPGFIHQMLASDWTLVMRCLSQRDLLNADHIVKMMNTEESRQVLEGELHFTQAETDIRKRLINLSDSDPIRKNEAATNVPQKSSLEAVQQVAAQAITTSALFNHVERFLSATTLPAIQGSPKGLNLGNVLQCMENSSGIVTVDLAITSTCNYQDFKDLLSLAGKHCPELTSRLQSSLPTSAASVKPLGFIAFAQTLMILLHELNKDPKTHTPIAKFLRTRHLSFSLKTLKEQQNFWKTLTILEEEVARSGRESEGANREVGKSKKNVKSMQKIFEKIAKVTETSSEILDIARIEGGNSDISKHVNYADLLNRYLSDLASLSFDFVTPKSDGEENITFHTLMKQSAVEVLDRLVFQYNVDTALLEKKAQQLGFNLTASLLWGYAPAVPQGPGIPSEAFSVQMPPNPQCVILNAYPDQLEIVNKETDLDITTVVQSILSKLLAKLKEFVPIPTTGERCCEKFVSQEALAVAADDGAVCALLETTSVLQILKLPLMQSNEAFTFYLNLANLMTLHCILQPTARESLCSVSPLVQEGASWFIGYELGGIGFVSIAQLKSIFCGEETGQLFPLNRRLTLKVPFESDPRAIFLLPLLQGITPAGKLTLATSESISTQLSSAIELFARRHIVTEGVVMTIPALLDWYLDAVLMREGSEGTTNSSGSGSATARATPLINRRRLQCLLDFLKENSQSSEWLASLKAWALSDLILRVGPKLSFPNVTLEYCWHDLQPEVAAVALARSGGAAAERWLTRRLSEPILKQLNESSRVVTDLVVRLHEARLRTRHERDTGGTMEMGQDVLLDERLRCLQALVSAPWLPALAPMFSNNVVLAALHKAPSPQTLWAHITKAVSEREWSQCWALLRDLPDFIVLSNANLRRIRDLVLFELATITSHSGNECAWLFAQQICDTYLRIECIQSNHSLWSASCAIRMLRSLLCDEVSLTPEISENIQSTIIKIKLFKVMCKRIKEFEGKSWFDISCLSDALPSALLLALIRSDQMSLFMEWINLPGGVLESIVSYIDVKLILTLARSLPWQLSELCFRLPPSLVLRLCDEVVPQLTTSVDITALRSLARICLKISDDDAKYQKLWLGVEMVSLLDSDVQVALLPLVCEPLLIIEQLVMNTRLDSLQLLLKKMRQLEGADVIPEDVLMDLLTKYASIAVQLEVIRVVNPEQPSFFVTPNVNWTIPNNPPNRSEWVPDNQVSVCMCCNLVTFSMFNRRHHCRRCGRVVCAACSHKRIKVDGYKEVQVRVCRNCFAHHSLPEAESSSSVEGRSERSDVYQWCLSLDPLHNAAVRAEFGFEHSPNAALCLSIFNLVSDSPEYTSRLLDYSEKLLELLQGRDTTDNPEVDYPVLIQIIRALVVGAKVRYGQAGLSTGVLSCDRLLSQVDVISLLVHNHCTHLIPPYPLCDKDNVRGTGATMRSLRDRLVEEELWQLAIELSMKAGLPMSGVWAAWGKTLLAAGCWSDARNKFSQCLTPASQHSRSSPMLQSICEIIEQTTFSSSRESGSALEILELLGTFKSVAAGKAVIRGKVQSGPTSPQYVEQEWYLTRYGNSTNLLKFYLEKQQWNTAINYALHKQIEPEQFNEIILVPAYRNHSEDALKSAITANDPTLENVKRYLSSACIYLQKMHCLHYLHNLQVFMQDYVRAAMTCIQLYQSEATTFVQLLRVSDLLQTALRHLEEELSRTEKKTKRPEYVMHMDQRDINRHMNTICRQLEVSKYLASSSGEATAVPLTSILTSLHWAQNRVPTLFDGPSSRICLAALCVLAGKNVEEGFGLSFRIIQDNGLDMTEVFSRVGVILGVEGRSPDLPKLAACIATCGAEQAGPVSDHVLSTSISAMAAAVQQFNFEALLSLISNVDLKIKALTELRQLKSAYLLAVKHNRLNLIQLIMEEAERTGQKLIRDICRKKLGLISESVSIASSIPSNESQ